ncbi:hypothetical protein FKP32DRAFT_1672675 [Trametes sanguinea]|nr:hypothetical protein FKP32DRAFT_1672675 [Trametes sanguinea]
MPPQVAAQAMQNPQLMAQYYNYARMPGMTMGQLPQAYWQLAGAGRGMPLAAQQMPGMPGAHPQQMQPGAGGAKPPQGGGQQGSGYYLLSVTL